MWRINEPAQHIPLEGEHSSVRRELYSTCPSALSPVDGGLDGEGHNVPRQAEDEGDAHRLQDGEAPAAEPLPRRGQQRTASVIFFYHSQS